MPRPQRTTIVRISPTEYARRHVIYRLNSTKGLIVMVVASLADDRGRARTTQWMIAEDIGKSLATVERAMRWLLDPTSAVLAKGGGRTYVLVGYATHDPVRCGHVECEAEYGAETVSARKRRLAADRARRYRAKKAAQTV